MKKNKESYKNTLSYYKKKKKISKKKETTTVTECFTFEKFQSITASPELKFV